jgi:DNA sulfur modification protein DndD
LEEIQQLKKEAFETVGKLEAEISSQGRWGEDAIGRLLAEKLSLDKAIPSLQNEIRDLCSGIAPFAIVDQWLLKIQVRIDHERDAEKAKHANEIVQQRITVFENSDIWEKLKGTVNDKDRGVIIHELKKLLLDTKSESISVPVHVLADNDRTKILNWIQLTNFDAPKELKRKTADLVSMEKELKTVKAELSKVAEQEVVNPIFTQLRESTETLGKLTAELEQCERGLKDLETEIFHAERKANSFEKKVKENRSLETRLGLAKRTQLVIKEYAQRLLEEKLRLFGRNLVNKFNELCRKPKYLDSAVVNPQSYQISLFKENREINQSFLSAGERQLLGISVLWALREMTKISLPLIIDTPMGRLDSEHRRSMLELFFPAVSHQVIILGTDEEIDDDAIRFMAPFIARIYQVEFNHETGESCLTERPIEEFEQAEAKV